MTGRYPLILLTFPEPRLLASTFMRVQEHYESPVFKGKTFTREEFLAWHGRVHGAEHAYVDYWDGFNVPVEAFAPFRQGWFDPLSEDERRLVGLVEAAPEARYVIGAVEGDRQNTAHEVVHGLYALDADYRADVDRTLAAVELGRAREVLRATGDYHEDVLDDEIVANALTGWDWLPGLDLAAVAAALRPVFSRRFGFPPDDVDRLLSLIDVLRFA